MTVTVNGQLAYASMGATAGVTVFPRICYPIGPPETYLSVNGADGAPAPGVPPINLTPPVIAGTNTVGSVLTCTPGTWSGTPTLTYRWFSEGTPIIGANGLTYQIQSSDQGNSITCHEIATSPTGIGQVSSNAIVVPIGGGFSTGFSTGFSKP